MNDEEFQLMQGVYSGDEESYRLFVKRYWSVAYGAAFQCCRNHSMAGDTAQNTMADLIRFFSQDLRDIVSLSAFVRRSAMHQVWAILEREKKEQERRSDGMWKTASYGLSEIERHEIMEQLHRCAARLTSDSGRKVVLLCLLEQHTLQEAADRLGKSSAWVHGQLKSHEELFKDCVRQSSVYRELRGGASHD